MTSKIMKSIKERKNDIVYTPQKIVDIMLKDCNVDETYLDPCFGEGIFYNSFPVDKDKKYFCEINREQPIDFFEFKQKVDNIISNPPYSKLTKWLEHSFKIAKKKVRYIVGMYSLTPARLTMAEKQGWFLTEMILTQVPTWFCRSYILTFEKLESKPDSIRFESVNLGNKCLYCGKPCGGTEGHCKRKIGDNKCYWNKK